MERMGHSSTRAALIYLHATRERGQAIAAGMGKLLKDAKKGAPHPIGHATGTRPEVRILKIPSNRPATPLTWAASKERATGIEPA
jgi:hypothetical protein